MDGKSTSLILRGDPEELAVVSRSLQQRHPQLALEQPGGSTGSAGDEALLFEHAPVALILVDAERRVLKINRLAAGLAGQVPRQMLDQVTGVAIGCANAQLHPEGCGHSQPCGQCGLRRVIERTFHSGRAQRQVETTATFGGGEAHGEHRLRVSTNLVDVHGETLSLLSVEEIVEEAGLPGGAAPPRQLSGA
jgi:hypothetical protein